MKKNLIVNLVVAVVLLGALGWVYNYQTKKINSLIAQREAEKKKNALIEDIGRQEKKLFAYKRLLTKKEASALMATVNKLASQNNIKIISAQPQSEEVRDAYIKRGIRLEIGARSYHDLGNFISYLEKSPEIFIVSTLSINSDPIGADKGTSLRANLIINTFTYKD